MYPAAVLWEMVPVVVIGPPVIAPDVAMFVTVPPGSSPDGIKIHEDPSETNMSPALADWLA